MLAIATAVYVFLQVAVELPEQCVSSAHLEHVFLAGVGQYSTLWVYSYIAFGTWVQTYAYFFFNCTVWAWLIAY